MTPASTRLSLRTLIVLGLLYAVPPLVSDVYLPALPDMARSLDTTTSMAQLTMSLGIIGLAVGQLVVGPISDRLGRMQPLKISLALYTLSSLGCAFAPEIWSLLGCRLLQGLAGSAMLVVSRAMVRDVYSGSDLTKVYSNLLTIAGFAPIAGPVFGGQLLRFTDWRGVFVALAALGVISYVVSVTVLEETGHGRTTADGAQAQLTHESTGQAVGSLFRDRRFMGYVAVGTVHGTLMFSYLSMAPFILSELLGMNAQQLSWVLGVNACAIIAGAQVNRALVGRVNTALVLGISLAWIVVDGFALGLTLVTAGPPWLVLVLLFLFCLVITMVGTNAQALGLASQSRSIGAAAALTGSSTFTAAAVLPPLLTALGGAQQLGWMLSGSAAVGVALMVAMVRPDWQRPLGPTLLAVASRPLSAPGGEEAVE